MNYSKYIFKLLKIKPEEAFRVNGLHCLYKITENLEILCYRNCGWCTTNTLTIGDILVGKCKIIKNITEREKLAIDYARACGMNWLCKDENGNIYAYEQKPDKLHGEWVVDFGSYVKIHIPIFFLSWKDEEPYYIGDVDDEF